MSTKKTLQEELFNEKKEAYKKVKSLYDFDNEEIPGVPLAKEFNQIDQADLDHIYELVAAWNKKYPDGPPMAKRLGPYHTYITTAEIMIIGKCSLRTAQRLLQNTRFVLQLKKNAYVRVDEFCQVNDKFREADVRAFLDALDAVEHGRA